MSDYRDQLGVAKLAALASETRKNEALALNAELESKFRERRLAEELALPSEAHIYSFHGPVTGVSAAGCIEELGQWSRQAPGCDITIVFNSPGGSVFEGLSLYDFIQDLRGRGHKVVTKSIGMAASMGGILLQAGDERVISSNGFVLIHEVSAGTGGKFSDVQDQVKFMDRLQDKLLKILAARSTITATQIRRAWKKTDWWLDADEALRLGFVDRVES